MSDTIPFACEACAYQADIPASFAGKTIYCPGCKAVQKVPASEQEGPEPELELEPPAQAAPRAPRPGPPPGRAARAPAPTRTPPPQRTPPPAATGEDDDGDEDDTPVPGSPRPTPLPEWLRVATHPSVRLLWVVGIIFLIQETVLIVAWLGARHHLALLTTAHAHDQQTIATDTAAISSLHDEVGKDEGAIRDLKNNEGQNAHDLAALKASDAQLRIDLNSASKARDADSAMFQKAQSDLSDALAKYQKLSIENQTNYQLRRDAERARDEEKALREKFSEENKILRDANNSHQ